jgi:hypothetical protein
MVNEIGGKEQVGCGENRQPGSGVGAGRDVAPPPGTGYRTPNPPCQNHPPPEVWSMRARPVVQVALFALLAAPVLAQEKKDEPPKKADDLISTNLRRDKDAYTGAVGTARENVLKAFDKYYESVKANKALKIDVQLAQLEKIEAEKKVFEDGDVLPAAPGMRTAVTEYRAAQKKAADVCKQAFERAAKAYRDEGDIKAAVAVLEEMKEFLAAKGGSAVGPAGAFVLATRNGGNKVLGLAGGSTADGTKVVTADYVKGDQSQLWRPVPAGDGWVYLENAKSGTVMSVAGNGTNNGAEVIIAKKAPGSASQLWKVQPMAGQKDAVKVVGRASGKLIGVDAKSTSSGARILLWVEHNDPSQWFGTTPPK